MTARVQITPPIGRDGFNCRNCGNPIFAFAKVVYDDDRAPWFVYEHGNGEQRCTSPTVAEPFDEDQAHVMVEARFAAQSTPEGAEKTRSAQATRVATVLDRLHATRQANREYVAAGDKNLASASANELRGLIEDLPMHDLRSLALRLFLAAKDESPTA